MKYSQERIAKEIGISRNTLSDAEVGKKPLRERQINIFCNSFGINKDYLLYGKLPKYSMDPMNKRALDLFGKLHPDMKKGLLLLMEHMIMAENDLINKDKSEK